MPERKKAFCDPYNPTTEELSKWAYDQNAPEPSQDWDIIITDAARVPIFIKFAADADCPKQSFFLSCLYLWVGDLVHCSRVEQYRNEIERILTDAGRIPGRVIYDWVLATRQLLTNPSSFKYADWCAGILATRSLNPHNEHDSQNP